MKVLQTLVLDKYSDTNRYTLVDGNVYKDISGGVGGQRECLIIWMEMI